MRFEQTCMICEKNKIEGGSDIETSVFIQFKAFIKSVEKKGWHVLYIDEKEMQLICPFCHRRMIKELKRRKND